jgi:aminoglycoside 2'-N-acetyltransferase I
VVAELQTAHTADLDPEVLQAGRALLYDVFDDMTEEDWEHSLGGIHALIWEGSELIGHGSVIQRRLLHGGRAWRAGYVEGVGVRADRRGHGHGTTMMAALERVIHRGYDLGGLGATDEAAAFYSARGWRLWRGRCSALTPDGIVRTEEEEGAIFVLPLTAPLDLSGELTCGWRDGDVW